MIQRRSTTRSAFSPLTTWIGVVILGSALTTTVVPPALANSAAIVTSSIAWPEAALDNGIVSGGTPRDYLTGTEGWGLAPLSSVGSMGLEWTSPYDPARREPFFGTLQESSIAPGGLSTWNTAGLLSPRPEQNFYATIAHRAQHNQLEWAIDLFVLDEDAMAPNRFYWIADLAPGYQAVYSSPAPGQLVISDASKTHPTLVLHATTTAGTLQWGGSGIYTNALADGEQEPTLYVYGTNVRELRISVTLGIIDHDPCSSATATNFAAANATAPATLWPSITECLGDASWTLETHTSEALEIPLDPETPPLDAGQERTLTISGLPDGVSWEPLSSDASGMAVTLTATDTVVPGDYPLAFEAVTTTTTGGVVRRSQPLRSTGSLRIDPAPVVIEEPEPEPAPEPEPVPDPEPAPEPEPEPEPEPVPDPEPVPEPDPEPVVDPTPVPETEEEPAPVETAVEDPVVVAPADPAPADPTPADNAPVEEPAPAAPQEIAPSVALPLPYEPIVSEVRDVETPALPEETFVPREPVEISLSPRQARSITMPEPLSPPEPLIAGAWLGLSLLMSLAAGGLIATLRRWRNQSEG